MVAERTSWASRGSSKSRRSLVVAKCKAGPMSLRRIGVCIRSGENDCGNIGVVEIHVTSAEQPGRQMLAASLFAVFNLRLSIFTPREAVALMGLMIKGVTPESLAIAGTDIQSEEAKAV